MSKLKQLSSAHIINLFWTINNISMHPTGLLFSETSRSRHLTALFSMNLVLELQGGAGENQQMQRKERLMVKTCT